MSSLRYAFATSQLNLKAEAMVSKNNGRNVFAWREFRKWRREVLSLLNDAITLPVIKELKRNPPRYFSSDFAWLDSTISKLNSNAPPTAILDLLLQRIPLAYPFVRGFHGCRPDSIEKYKKHGLLPSNIQDLNKVAFEIFGETHGVKAAIQELASDDLSSYAKHNEGKIFFCLDYNELVQNCGHYMAFGSEYLLSIGDRVGGVEKLRQRGKATIIECNIPISYVPLEYLKGICAEILIEIFQRGCDPEYLPEPALNCGFPIHAPIKPKNIIHFHFHHKVKESRTGILYHEHTPMK